MRTVLFKRLDLKRCGLCLIAPLYLAALGTFPLHAQQTPANVTHLVGTPNALIARGFEIATIKPSDANYPGWKMEFTVDGFTARSVTVRMLIREAYGLNNENPIIAPPWIDNNRFDVEAKFNAESVAGFAELSLEQRRIMLREFLADRFKLLAHIEDRLTDGMELRVAKGGAHLRTTTAKERPPEIKGMDGLVLVSRKGQLKVNDTTIKGFARLLNHAAGRIVEDKTGLEGHYDIVLHWNPDDLIKSDSQYPPLGTALQEQLGLQLHSARLASEVFVIQRIELPTPN